MNKPEVVTSNGLNGGSQLYSCYYHIMEQTSQEPLNRPEPWKVSLKSNCNLNAVTMHYPVYSEYNEVI